MVNGYIEEMMHGQKVVKIFNHENKAKAEFAVLNEELRQSATDANKNANQLMPIMMNLLNIQYVLVAVIGGLLAIYGNAALSVGMLVSFLQLSRSLNGPISQISQQINFVIMALAGAERIFDLLDEEVEVDDGYVTLVNVERQGEQLVEASARTGLWAWKHPHSDGSVTYTQLTGDVVFEDVDFGYNSDKMVLHDINLYAEPGQKVAFVGATGAGKTTITNLINRFYDIQDGKIRYDGINIKKIKKHSLRRSLGIVLQDTHLFSDTIRDNIRYGKLDATDEEVEAAAKLANAHSFIQHLPEKYDTQLSGDGEGLSQGQRQLLAIARAAIADPPVMIMDEATSSIDTRTETIVQSGMDKLMAGRTVFVIAHRLSTIQNSDVIMVMDHGRIIERGSHDSLLAEKGMYYQLYTGKVELD
ncbi:ABC-type multidrug transport system fused ATPase/permease subunit [Enterococcus sp. PF1-24]|nr:ABC-type multidrug transport system fused ATPase/permease subunit [Enterococcus sp. PFB1-1]MDH6401992.1 ABC-type multidrug transport system fused ATPase/permease subunit [Enterococcus sp. PF1-24]